MMAEDVSGVLKCSPMLLNFLLSSFCVKQNITLEKRNAAGGATVTVFRGRGASVLKHNSFLYGVSV